MKFDDILKEIGEFGTYQKWVTLVTCVPALHVGAMILLNVVIFGVPDHRCKIPGLDNDTWDNESPEHKALLHYYIPPSADHPYDRCHLYVHHNTSNQTGGNVSEVKCHKWVYDTSVFKYTFTEQVNLVCDDALLISHAQTVYYFGILVGSIFFGQLADIIGRKKSLYIGLMVMLISAVSLTFAPEFYSFAAIYFILGSASVSNVVSAFVICMEYVGPSKRLWAVTWIGITGGLGSMYFTLMSYLLRDWQKIELSIGVPAVIYVFYICIVPESPRWLLSKNRRQEAIDIITKVAKRNGKELPEKVISSLETDKDHTRGTVWQLFSTKTLAFRTIILYINWFVVSMSFYGVLLNVGNLGGDFYLNLFLISVVDNPSRFITLALLNRIGRKKLYIGYMLLGGLCCIGTIYPVVQKTESLHWLLVTLSVLGKMFVAGAFEVLYILSGELFPTVVRNVGLGTSSAWARAGSMLSPYIAKLGDLVTSSFAGAIPLTIIGVATFIGGLLSFTLPETLNKKLPDTVDEADNFAKSKREEITVTIDRSEYKEL